jgi:tetratricopeptide (TPR) repeat protein
MLVLAGVVANTNAIRAQTTTVPPQADISGTASRDPLTLMIENAVFWDQKGRFDVALRAWERVLDLSPNNTSALARAAYTAFAIGQRDKAAAYRDKLRALEPSNSELPYIDAEAQRGSAQSQQIDEARRLAKQNKPAESVKMFEKAFAGGSVPRDMALEYYLVLSQTSEEGRVKATDAYTALAKANPNNPLIQLSFANFMRMSEDTRSDGLDALEKLSKVPEVSKSARIIWRETLLWLSDDSDSRDRIITYLADNPSDPQIAAKKAEIESFLPSAGFVDRMTAYGALTAGNRAEAGKAFRSALEHDPQDVDAMIGLATILRQDGKIAEVKKLIARALELAPDRREEFSKALGYDPAIGPPPLPIFKTSALSPEQYKEFTRLLDAKQYAEAEAYFIKGVGGQWDADLYKQLGLVQISAKHYPQAEQSLRSALKLSPNDANTMLQLGNALIALDRPEDAAPLFDQAATLLRNSGTAEDLRAIQHGRAEALRQRALKLSEPMQRADALRAALAIDPSDSWLRLDLAKLLAENGYKTEAKNLMAEVTRAPRPTKEDVLVGLLYAQISNDADEQLRLYRMIPPSDLSGDLKDIGGQLQLRDDIERANALGNRAATRQRLVSLMTQPDPTGTRGLELGKALNRLGDKPLTAAAVLAAFRSSPKPAPQQRLAYASVLIEADHGSDAAEIMAKVTAADFPATSLTWYNQVRDAITVYQSEAARAGGHYNTAIATLAQRLRDDRNNVVLNLALVRAYQSQNDLTNARSLANALLARNPDDKEVQLAVIALATLQRDFATVDTLTTRGRALYPEEIRYYLAAGAAEQATGRFAQAAEDAKIARQLRAKQDAATADADAANSQNTVRDDLLASLMFAVRNNDIDEQLRLYRQIPASELTGEFKALVPRLQELDRMNRPPAPGNLLLIQEHLMPAPNTGLNTAPLAAAAPTPSLRGLDLARALLRRGDKPGAAAAAINALRAVPNPGAELRLGCAAVLFDAGRGSEAAEIMAQLSTSNVPQDKLAVYNQLRDNITVQQSEAARAGGHYNAAIAVLTQRLRQDRDNVTLNMALVRAYLSQNDLVNARALSNALLARNPDDKEVQLTTIAVATAQHDFTTVDELAARGRALYPDEMRYYLAAGTAEKATGRFAQAMEDFKIAKQLRARQAGVDVEPEASFTQ